VHCWPAARARSDGCFQQHLRLSVDALEERQLDPIDVGDRLQLPLVRLPNERVDVLGWALIDKRCRIDRMPRLHRAAEGSQLFNGFSDTTEK
jgi:hypothetical protein